MPVHKNVYRKNLSLIIIFLVLISVTFVIALFVSYSLTAKYVENEFASKKIEVLEQTIKPYNDFFQNKIPEITSYQGFLDSASAAKYATSVFHDYKFVRKVVFYDVLIGSKTPVTIRRNNLNISVKAVYIYWHKNGKMFGARQASPADESDFKEMAVKLNNYIAFSDTSRVSTQDELFKTFWDVKPDKISYSNVLRHEDIKIYRDLQQHNSPSASYKQNMMTFFLDPYLLKIRNPRHELYQNVSIQPVVYDPIDSEGDKMITEVSFPGAFSDYKLFFSSEQGYLTNEINKRFMPIGAVV